MSSLLNVDNFQAAKLETLWKHDLYALQLKAPKPKRVVCQAHIPDRPPHYGREFHGKITREEANKLLSGEDGRYLVRESVRAQHQYTLSLRFEKQTKHFRLYYDGKHFVGDKRFDTVHDLVADGLIIMYLETHACDYIASMSNVAYEETPHYTLQKSHKLQKKMFKDQGEINKIDDLKIGIKRIDIHEPDDEVYDDVIDVQMFEKKHGFKSHNYMGLPFCDYCGNFMWGLLAQGLKCEDCGFNAHRKCSEKVPNDCCPDLKHIHRIFGIDLTAVVKACNTVRPFIIDICVKEIENRGLHIEGLYRVSGLSDDVEAIKVALERDWDKAEQVFKSCDDVHVITGVLKMYLRSLPIPLISFDAYPHFLSALKKNALDEKISGLKDAVSNYLAPAHYQSLQYLIAHLERVSQHADENLMSAHNLSTVLCPTLMRTPNIGLKPFQLNSWDQEIHVLEILIKNHSKIFR
ncbi:N-chimaerin-like [Panonychus citri]|uniref:N-chimaerin-like n=1 Tax=Panonychus citri TaxID=50023 RepID=UPI0023080B80|nr:N-chimaerin-like [Panonychus citri]XP_053209687.1 N-chimaerin-like [Panonychus citri]